MRNIIGDYQGFVATINRRFVEVGIDAGSELVMCDHLCYRVDSQEEYVKMQSLLSKVASNIGEVPVSGRLITTFELHEPLEVGGWTIPYIELPAPKPGSPYPSGLEHAEFVVVSLGDFQNRHNNLPFNDKGMSKVINPELGLNMGDVSVKFHEISLGAVVRLEERLDRE